MRLSQLDTLLCKGNILSPAIEGDNVFTNVCVHFTHIHLEFGVVVAEHDPKCMLQAQNIALF